MLMGAGPQRPTQTIKMFFRSMLNVQSLSRSANIQPGKETAEDLAVSFTLRNDCSTSKSPACCPPPPPISQDTWMKATHSQHTHCLSNGDAPGSVIRLSLYPVLSHPDSKLKYKPSAGDVMISALLNLLHFTNKSFSDLMLYYW